ARRRARDLSQLSSLHPQAGPGRALALRAALRLHDAGASLETERLGQGRPSRWRPGQRSDSRDPSAIAASRSTCDSLRRSIPTCVTVNDAPALSPTALEDAGEHAASGLRRLGEPPASEDDGAIVARRLDSEDLERQLPHARAIRPIPLLVRGHRLL